MTPQRPNESAESTARDLRDPAAEEQVRRAAIYSLLAAFLRDAPDTDLLAYANRLDDGSRPDNAELPLAFKMLALASRHSTADSLRDEYQALFIGLGRGELVPYGSWYQTGFLMERPLGELRADLARLGFERADDVHEPEDHIAALCEVMALLIQDEVSLERQRRFFDDHIGPWAGDFFRDLAEAQSAVFYRSVARLGTAFLSLEARYLSLLG